MEYVWSTDCLLVLLWDLGNRGKGVWEVDEETY